MSTLIGIVTFGNLEFTKLAVQGIRETVTKPYDIFIVVGKWEDTETKEWVKKEGIPHIVHELNMGFPASVNDIYDFAWKENDYDNLVIIGNDVIPYPYAIDSMIEVADTTDYEWVCAKQYDVKGLCKDYPQAKEFFKGDKYLFTDFNARPWELFEGYSEEVIADEGTGLSDVHNLALFTKSVFDKIGYIDVNFYPAYYEDNDYVRRAIRSGVKSCTVDNSYYFHFWSRTIHQGQGGSTNAYFNMNRNFYILKWGGDFMQETFEEPFNGGQWKLAPGLIMESEMNIQDRDLEKEIIRIWRSKAA